MAFNWCDFLIMAKGLHSDPGIPGPEEAAFRTAASRAYYAAYKLARVLADQEGYTRQRGNSDHYDVKEFFRKHWVFRFSVHSDDPNKRKEIATKLGRMSKNRVKADYDSILTGLTATDLAAANIQMADEVIELLDQLSI